MRFLSRTPVRLFIIYPVARSLGAYLEQRPLDMEPMFVPLMAWGYLQYRLCGRYRIKHGAGGPGLETPPDRVVSTGPYAYTRNPMYLGHLSYLLGLSLTLQSWLGAVITIAIALWFQAPSDRR